MTSWAALAVVLVACQLKCVTSETSETVSHLGACTDPESSLAPTADVSWAQSDVSLNSVPLHHLGGRTLLHASVTDGDVFDGSAQYQAALAAVSDWWPFGGDVEIPVGNVHAWHPEPIIHNQIQADPRPETQPVPESHWATYFSWQRYTDLLSSHHNVGNWPTLSSFNGVMEMPTGDVHAGHPYYDQIMSESLSCAHLPRHCPDLVSSDLVIRYGVTLPSSAVDGVGSNGNVLSSSISVPLLPSAHSVEQIPFPFNSNECPPTDLHRSVDFWYGEHGLWSTTPDGNVVSSIGNHEPAVPSILFDVHLPSFDNVNSEGHFPNAFHSPITQVPTDASLTTWPSHAFRDTPIDTHSIDSSRIMSFSHADARTSSNVADCCSQSSPVFQKPQLPDNGHWMETASSNGLSAAECISMQCSQDQVGADQYTYNMFIPATLNPPQIREGDYGTFSSISEPPSLQSLHAASSHDPCPAVPFPPDPVRAQDTAEEFVSMSVVQLQQGLPKPHRRRPGRPYKKCEHGRQRRICRICSPHKFCQPHGRPRSTCTKCGGSSTCVHRKLTYRCRDCGGKGICAHKRRRQDCRECQGSRFCKHDKDKYRCKVCGLCVHKQSKRQCGQCRRAAEPAMA